jgi:hypothetical protein
MEKWKKTLITVCKVISVFFVLCVIGFFGFRNLILTKAIQRITQKALTDYHAVFVVTDARFTGLTEIELTKVSLVPPSADTLFSFASISASIGFWNALSGNIQLKKLEVNDGFIQLIKNDSGRNFDAFLSSKNDTLVKLKKVETTSTNYAKIAYKLISRVLNLVPTHMSLSQLDFRTNDMGLKVDVYLENLTLIDEQLQSTILVQTNTFSQHWSLTGTADPRGKQTDV